ncbi:hypothetical protein ACOSQ4_010537 [Xanthoceras sorbifolium]
MAPLKVSSMTKLSSSRSEEDDFLHPYLSEETNFLQIARSSSRSKRRKSWILPYQRKLSLPSVIGRGKFSR